MASTREVGRVPLAVVGVGALFPGSSDATGFWNDIVAGTDRIGPVPAERWLVEDYYDPDPAAPDRTYANRGAFLDAHTFDALRFGMPPTLAPTTDSTQLLALIVAQQVLDDATRGQFASMDRSRVSCILGVTSAQELLGTMVARLQRPVWTKALRESGLPEDEVQAACDRIASHYVPWQESTFPGVLGNVIAGRIANRFDLRGTNCVTDAACASAFSALSMAANELYLGESDLVITGGCDTMNDIFMFMCFSKTPALSATGDCRPFSDRADGTMLGEGLGMVALKRLADAERDGDAIYAVVQGVGSSSDGRAKSVYAPVPEGQARALRRAYEAAGVSPATVELVEAHGTGTRAGDAAEFAGLCEVFAPAAAEARQWCALGSVKSQIGHTKSTAGAAGLIKAVLAVRHGVLPPTLKVDAPNPKLEIEQSPFYLNTRTRPWIRGADHPRRAGVSSFGFGGTNFHVVVEEYRGPGARAAALPSRPAELLAWSASTPADLLDQLARTDLRGAGAAALRAESRALLAAFDAAAPVRLCLVAATADAAADRIDAASKRIAAAPESAFATPDGVFYGRGDAPGPVALLFSGQGSQYVDMGADLAVHFDAARDVWDAAAALEIDGEPLHRIAFPRPAFTEAERDANDARLTDTRAAQPAIGAASAATLTVLRELGLSGAMAGGHSFGELTALFAGGAWDLDTFLAAACARGNAMHAAAATPGTMCAVATDIETVRGLLVGIDGAVVANHNAPAQVVVSGTLPAIDEVVARASNAGHSVRRINVSTAFHSPIVAPAAQAFGAFVDAVDLSAPATPIYSNSTASPYPSDPAACAALLGPQLAAPVRFVEMIDAMYAAGARVFVEVGPGAIQTRLVQQCLEGRDALAVATDRRGRNGVVALLEGVAQLAATGVPLRLAALWDGVRGEVDPRTVVRPPGAIEVSGANIGSPYPPRGGAAALPPPNPPRAAVAAPVAPAVAAPNPSRAASVAAPFAPPPSPSPTRTMSDPNHRPPPPEVATAWLHAFTELQRQTAAAHETWQRAMTESHQAFLRAAEASLAGLNAALGGAAAPTYVAAPAPPVAFAPAHAPAPAPVYAAPQPAPAPMYAPPAPTPAPVAAAPAPTPALTPAPTYAAPTPAPAKSAADPAAVLLAVVAEKTGYPVEMLQLGMALEADLGVDSIKRVEILSTLAERLPQAAGLDPNRLAPLATLQELVDALGGAAPATPPAPSHANGANGANGAHAAHGAGAAAQPVTAATPSADAAATLLAVVAEKTGYPVEMLQPTMALEADLGIDSIKRVEILSALGERVPRAASIDSARAATLVTLADVIEAMAAEPGAPPPNGAAAAGVAPHPKVGRFEVIEAPVTLPNLALAALTPGCPVCVVGAGATATALRAELEGAGYDAGASLETAAVVVDTAGVDTTDPDAAVRASFRTLREFARGATVGRAFVAALALDGHLGLAGTAPERTALAGIAGLAKTAAIELPDAEVRVIDAGPQTLEPAVLATRVLAELERGGPTLEVAIDASGARRAPVAREVPAGDGALPVGTGDLIVVSGGARGVTAHCVVALARATGAAFALLGRTPLATEDPALADAHDDAAIKRALLAQAVAAGHTLTPADVRRHAADVLANREIRATLAAIEGAGGNAEYVAVDVRDQAALEAALDRLRQRFGPVRGLVHGAGVLADRALAQKTDEEFARVWETKVDGLRTLEQATAADPLALVALFSSIAARTGNVGQCDYAAANEALNRRAAAIERERPGCRVVSLGWGPWRGGMVDAALERRFEALGVSLIALDAGALAFVDALRVGGPREWVLGADPRRAGIGEGGAREARAALRLSADSHPWLLDHSFRGAPVVPVAAVVDAMVRFAEAVVPGACAATVDDVRVLRGLRLPELGPAPVTLALHARAAGPDRVDVELLDPAGRSAYRATVCLREELEAHTSMTRHDEHTSLSPDPAAFEADADAYGGVLFHGPALHVVGRALYSGADGLRAPVGASRSVGLENPGGRVDVAALDGALQLALLWTDRALQRPSLPMSVGSVELGSSGARVFDGEVTPRSAAGSTGRCDITLRGPDGEVAFVLRGVETVAVPPEA